MDKSLINAPTARPVSHKLILSMTVLGKRRLSTSAYLQTAHMSPTGKAVHIRVDKETTKLVALAFPDMTEYITRDGAMICVVSKALYGLIESAWLWYKECTTTLSSAGFNVIDADKGVAFKKIWTGQYLFASVHVDDFMASASPRRSNRDDIEDDFF